MNKDELMKHLGYITVAYNRFRAASGRDTGFNEHMVVATLRELVTAVDAASIEFDPDSN